MIIYCAISFYLAAAMSTDGLNWFPAAFSAYRGWGENVINLSNAMAGIGGWIGVVAAVIFSVMAENGEVSNGSAGKCSLRHLLSDLCKLPTV